MMGGRQRRSSGGRKTAASDLRYNMEITLEEAFAGRRANPRSGLDSCTEMSGNRRQARHPPVTCSMCMATARCGQRKGFFSIERTCRNARAAARRSRIRARNSPARALTENARRGHIPALRIEDGHPHPAANEARRALRGGPSGDFIFSWR